MWGMLQPGASIPEVTLVDAAGEAYVLRPRRGKRLLVTFYVKDSTPACTQQVCELAKLASEELDVVAIGPGSVKTHASFAASHKLRIPLLVDVDGKGGLQAAGAFGAWGEKSMYGKKYMGVVRSTFLVGVDGKVEQVWENIRAKGHAAAVAEAIAGGGVGRKLGLKEAGAKKAPKGMAKGRLAKQKPGSRTSLKGKVS